MNTSKCLFATAIAGMLSMAYCARADDATTKSTDDDHVSYPLYRPQELNLDLYGSGSLGEETVENLSDSRFRHHVLYGGGGGLTMFFMRYIGVGGEFDADARASRFVDSASGNVYLRYPILNTGLAPYIFGGGGYQFEEIRQSFEQGGGGLEYRFCRNVGIFADGRWVFSRRTDDHALVRAGLRFSF